MNTLRTILVFSILGAVGYGVYSTLTQKPPVDPPDVVPEDWVNGPVVQLPGQSAGPEVLGGTAPPGFEGGSPAVITPAPQGAAGGAPLGEAPRFESVQGATPGMAPPEAFAGGDPAQAPPIDYGATLPPAGGPEAYQATPGDPGSAVGPPGDYPPPQANDPGQFSPADVAPPYTPGAVPDAQDPAAAALPPGEPPPGGVDNAAYPPQQPSHAPNGASDFATDMQHLQQQLDEGRLADAHLTLSRWCDNPQLADEQRRQVNELLDQLAGSVVYSREPLLEPPYEVQPGDTLERVAAQYNVPWQLLAKINGIQDPHHLQAGNRLKVVRGPFTAVVDLASFQLTLWLDGRYAGRFPIGVGRDLSTPIGTFEIKDKVENPIYYGPDQVIDADDPNNPLGERWLSLGSQIGIHGTNDPQSLGKAESRGCIRLSERDIDDVYDILSVGSKVIIRR